MQVDLSGQAAWLARDVPRAVAEILERNGARVALGADGDPCPDLAAAAARFGRLDIVAAGDASGIDATALLFRAAARPMRASGGGRIIAFLSVRGLVVQRGAAEHAARHAALAALTRALALELAEAGVRVNAIAAGAVAHGDDELVDADRRMLSHIPLGRAGSEADLARAALFLADPENAYMTGHVLPVDGGWSAGYGRDF